MIIIELFAGVGVFRLGLEGYNPKKSKDFYSLLNGFKKGTRKVKLSVPGYFITGFANQYEPSTKVVQHAATIYKSGFRDNTLLVKSVEEINADDILNKIK